MIEFFMRKVHRSRLTDPDLNHYHAPLYGYIYTNEHGCGSLVAPTHRYIVVWKLIELEMI